jgi:ferredoxin
MSKQLRVNPIACTGHGLCAELLPELVTLDEWGYPVLAGQQVPPALERRARSAVASCPALALRLSAAPLKPA